ncbi:MAG: bifunctional homocysteine S-methyltransferase/methylenetetrahydrofolate reductase [Clostridia bacterium]|nr:bifunctional homocysteine S-methyltransferase/methylenetetrahydrofolate reductase [Clostridia bacterium]
MPDFRFDGAFGTLYGELGGKEEICELANLTDRSMVKRIHHAYIAAGADAIKTNTYQANRTVIADERQLRNVIAAGYELALDAAGDQAKVFADIGNVAAPLAEASAACTQTARIFCELGAGCFLFETLDDIEPVEEAVAYVRENVPGAVIILSFAVAQDGYTRRGIFYAKLIERALEIADYAGLNCICGPAVMHELAAGLGRLIPGLDYSRLSLMPNASYPARQNGRMMFSNNPSYFADKLSLLAALGAGIIGGCCGTTPAHMEAAYRLLDSASPAAAKMPDPPAVTVRHSALADFDYSRKLIAVELNPPLNCDASFFMEAARRFVDRGADALTVTDSPLSRARADTFMLSAKLRRELGIEVLPHLTCRDRNRVAIKGTLMAASIEEIGSLLAITGDSPDAMLRADGVKGVYNLSSNGLISYVDSLNRDVLASAPYYIAAALNVNVPNFSAELERAKKKLSLGASMLVTQAMFTPESVENLCRARGELPGCRILAGVMPLAGYKNAMFLSNEVGGITIPQELCESMKDASPERTKEISVGYSRSMIEQAWDFCDGFYLMFPLKKVDFAEALVDFIKEKDGRL